MDIANLPFNKVLGLRTDEDHILLEPHSQHLNHLNTIHAAVIFSIAEAAAGQCLLRRFPDLTHSFVTVLRSTETKYRKPAFVDSTLRGTGKLGDVEAAEFLKSLQSRGRAMVDVFASVVQNDQEIFLGTFTWFAASK